jgi:hypothetical protein
MHKKSQVKKIFWEFLQIFMVQHRNLFQDSNIPKYYLTQIRGFSWHKNEIKRMRSGYYSSNNFQDSNKRKITESKTIGYLPRVLFINAWARRRKCKSSIFKRGIKIYCRSLLLPRQWRQKILAAFSVVWYVSNVSIIFDAPCLFLHHLPTVSLHFMALLCIFRN